MRVLGYVNRYSWGVLEVQDRLEKNGNGLPEFDLSLVTAFLVKEHISPRGAEARRNAIKQGYMMGENGGKLTSESDIDGGKLTSETPNMGENETPPPILRENEGKPDPRTEIPTE